MDEPPVLNGRVSSRELYAAISSLREELGSAQRAQTADVMAAVAATEQRLSSRIERTTAGLGLCGSVFGQPTPIPRLPDGRVCAGCLMGPRRR